MNLPLVLPRPADTTSSPTSPPAAAPGNGAINPDALAASERLVLAIDRADAMLARVGSDATTRRSLLAAPSSAAVGRYDLDSWVADLTVDYGMALGDIRLAPRVGLTYVDTKRDAVAENGAGAFALSIDKKRMRGLYGDVALQLSSTLDAGGTVLARERLAAAAQAPTAREPCLLAVPAEHVGLHRLRFKALK